MGMQCFFIRNKEMFDIFDVESVHGLTFESTEKHSRYECYKQLKY